MENIRQDGVNKGPAFFQRFSQKEDILRTLDTQLIANDQEFYEERLGTYNKLCAKLLLLLGENMVEYAHFLPDVPSAGLQASREGSTVTISSFNLFESKKFTGQSLVPFLIKINTLSLEELQKFQAEILKNKGYGLTYVRLLIEIRTLFPHISLPLPTITTTNHPDIKQFHQTIQLPYISRDFSQRIASFLTQDVHEKQEPEDSYVLHPYTSDILVEEPEYA